LKGALLAIAAQIGAAAVAAMQAVGQESASATTLDLPGTKTRLMCTPI
jgi:hypothetical protein